MNTINDSQDTDLEHEQSENKFDLVFPNGRVASLWKANEQAYSNCVLSSGLVEGFGDDTIYFRLARTGEDPITLLMRPDEALSMIHLVSGALWSQDILKDTGDGV